MELFLLPEEIARILGLRYSQLGSAPHKIANVTQRRPLLCLHIDSTALLLFLNMGNLVCVDKLEFIT